MNEITICFTSKLIMGMYACIGCGIIIGVSATLLIQLIVRLIRRRG